jgi:hypothetical protein
MKRNLFRKLLVILIIVAPLASFPGCKKQAKCGCGKDILFTLTNERANVYWDTGSTISFRTLNDPYSTYNFCNPGEMFPKMSDYQSGDELLVSGHAYWNCTYVQQAGNSSGYGSSLYKIYDVQVTNVYMNLYGK